MDEQKFLAEFEHIANSPNGIFRLRELILALAVQGKLTKQADSETVNFHSDLDFNENQNTAPFTLPNNWIWFKFGSVLDFQGGGQPPKGMFSSANREGFVQLIQIRDLGESPQPVFIPKELASKFCTPSDILVGRYGASVGKVFWGKHGAYNVALVKMIDLFELYDKKFLFILLQSPLGQNIFGGISRSAQDGFNKKDIESKLVPVAPIQEQIRIVAKVNELMALCDKLEAQQQKRRKLQNALRQSTLQAVVNAFSPNELETTWMRLAANFGKLFSFPEDVVAFKGLVLDLAVSGHLLNLKSGRASSGTELLEKIAGKRIEWSKKAKGQEEKEALTMLKKLRAQKVTIPELSLPEHWAWASLLQVSQALVDCHNKTAPYVSNGIHLIRTTDIRNGYMDLSNTRKISEETYAYWSKRMPPKAGDIFFTREAPMGEAAIVPEGETVCLGQ